MAKDFGDDSLPLSNNPPGQYLPAGHLSPIQVTTWEFLTTGLMHLLHICVATSGAPGWTTRAGNIIILIVPMESEFRRRWWTGNGEVADGDWTGLLESG